MELMGQVAIVTGSATGIGAATAQMLAAKGCNVVVNYRQSADAAEETAGVCQGLGVETLLLQGDVADDADFAGLPMPNEVWDNEKTFD